MAINIPCAGIAVECTDELDGCGGNGALDMLIALQRMVGSKHYERCLEWCSGPGFIGFAMLGSNKCDTLDLMEIYEPNRIVVQNTINKNNLGSKVRFYLSDNFKQIPKGNRYDLIVGNPPHFSHDPYVLVYDDPRKYKDENWEIHRDFFDNVNDYLTPTGEIFLMENCWGSSPTTFAEMLDKNDLKIIQHTRSTKYPNDVWYARIGKK